MSDQLNTSSNGQEGLTPQPQPASQLESTETPQYGYGNTALPDIDGVSTSVPMGKSYGFPSPPPAPDAPPPSSSNE